QAVPDLKIGTKQGEVPAADVKKLIEVLLDESSLRDGQRRALQVERAGEVEAARSPQSFARITNQEDQQGMSFVAYLMRPIFLKDGRILLRNTTEVMENAAASKDWPEFGLKAKEVVGRIGGVKTKSVHILAAILTPALDTAIERDFRAMTQRRLTATALALRLYFVENGKW